MTSKKHPSGTVSKLFRSFVIIGTVTIVNFHARATSWTYGFALGLGGTGIQTSANVNGSWTKIQRGETPGLLSLFADRAYNDFWSLSIEHLRGFRLGPFTSGLSFTGVGFKWYFLNPIPSFPKPDDDSTRLFIQQFSPYLSGASGVATGTITRSGDLVYSVTGSGLYFGFRAGSDYMLEPGMGLRGELSYSTTLLYAENPKVTMTEGSLRIGIFFFY